MTDWTAAQTIIDVVSGKWSLRILIALDSSPLRFSELLRTIDSGIRHKVLTETLQRMQRIGMVQHRITADGQTEACYELTSLARSLMEPLTSLANWAATHQDIVHVLDTGR